MLHKKTISSNIQTKIYRQKPIYRQKTKKNRKKTTKIGLAYVQFYKTKLHRGKKRH